MNRSLLTICYVVYVNSAWWKNLVGELFVYCAAEWSVDAA